MALRDVQRFKKTYAFNRRQPLYKIILNDMTTITGTSFQEFGAVGDGTTDDTSAIQTGLDTSRSDLVFRSGTYRISSPLSVPSGRTVFGEAGAVVLLPLSSTFAAFDFDGVSNVMMQGVRVTTNGVPSSGGFGFYVRGSCTDIRFVDCEAQNTAGGFIIRGESGSIGGVAERISYINCRSDDSKQLWGFEASYSDRVEYIGCHADSNWLDGFKIRALSSNISFLGGSATNNGQDPVNAGDGIDAFAGGDTFLIEGTVCDDNLGNGITIKTDSLTRDEPNVYGYVRNIQVSNVMCRNNNPGYGLGLYVFRSSRNSYFDSGSSATIPLPQHGFVRGGIFEGNRETGLWIDGHNIVVDSPIVRGNGEHGIEVGVRSINTTLNNVMVVANGTQSGTWNGVYLRGKHIRMRGGHVFGVDPDIVRFENDLTGSTPTHDRNVLVDSTFSEDVEIIDVLEDYNLTSAGIRTNMSGGHCVIHQKGTGSPVGVAYGGPGSSWIQLSASQGADVLWVKTTGAPNNPNIGWNRTGPGSTELAHADFDDLVRGTLTDAVAGITLLTTTTGVAAFAVSDTSGSKVAEWEYNHSDNTWRCRASGAVRFRANSAAIFPNADAGISMGTTSNRFSAAFAITGAFTHMTASEAYGGSAAFTGTGSFGHVTASSMVIGGAGGGVSPNAVADELCIGNPNSSAQGFTLMTNSTTTGTFAIGNLGDNDEFMIQYIANQDKMRIIAGGDQTHFLEYVNASTDERFGPSTDNRHDLGQQDVKWKAIYGRTGTFDSLSGSAVDYIITCAVPSFTQTFSYLPLVGGTHSGSTLINQIQNAFICPYSGYVRKVQVRRETISNNNTMYIQRNYTTSTIESSFVPVYGTGTVHAHNFTGTNHFSQGDVLHIGLDIGTATNINMNFTVHLRFFVDE